MNHNLPCYRITKYDQDEAVLPLKRAAIQAKLKLKKLQKNLTAMSQEHTADTTRTVFKRAREKAGCNHNNPKCQRTAAKYKQYSKIHGSTSTISQPPSPNRPHEDSPFVIPLPLHLSHLVPAASKAPMASAATHFYNSPLSTLNGRPFGNHSRDSVGPTPQKTGKILGIFESFSNVDHSQLPGNAKSMISLAL
ncbi:hypothetical protein Q9L58_006866 [Maublancomyces gigas]|uniref:Uncharacterized protein n=1 Tax=Discina gigas TaxID=1032678 RepID=A0ABR3GE58_9PEZI